MADQTTKKQNVVTHYYKLYNGKCWMQEEKLDRAIRDGVMLEIHYHPTTSTDKVYLRDPKAWKETGERWNHVFRKPHDPMKLIGNYLDEAPKELPPAKIEQPTPKQQSLF